MVGNSHGRLRAGFERDATAYNHQWLGFGRERGKRSPLANYTGMLIHRNNAVVHVRIE